MALVTLLVGGGLNELQTASVLTGLPFALIILMMIYSLNVGLKQEFEIEEIVRKTVKEVKNKYLISEVIE